MDEQLAAGSEPACDGGESLFELRPGEEVQDVGGVNGGEAGLGEVEILREATGQEGEFVGFDDFGEVGGIEVVGDDGGTGFDGGERREAEGGADIENGEGDIAAMGHEQLTDFVELIRGPAGFITGGDAAVHATY